MLAEEKQQHFSSIDMVENNGLSFQIKGKKNQNITIKDGGKQSSSHLKSVISSLGPRLLLCRVWSGAQQHRDLAARLKCSISGPAPLNQTLL